MIVLKSNGTGEASRAGKRTQARDSRYLPFSDDLARFGLERRVERDENGSPNRLGDVLEEVHAVGQADRVHVGLRFAVGCFGREGEVVPSCLRRSRNKVSAGRVGKSISVEERGGDSKLTRPSLPHHRHQLLVPVKHYLVLLELEATQDLLFLLLRSSSGFEDR